MNQSNHILSIPMSCEKALLAISDSLQQVGLQTVRSFDLQVARSVHADCSCPHHGTKDCDCQLVVLLVYGYGSPPATILAHGREVYTQFYLVDSPQQRPDPVLEKSIRKALASAARMYLDQRIYENDS